MRLPVIALVLLLSACTPAAGVDPLDPVAPEVARFEAAEAPGDRALFVSADFSVPGTTRVSVWGQGLGDVFGFAFHLALDGATPAESTLEPVLGTDAYTLVSARGGDVAFGAARPGLESGTSAVSAPTRLATVRLDSPSRQVAVRLERAQVRDARGDLIPIRAVGGTVFLPEAQ